MLVKDFFILNNFLTKTIFVKNILWPIFFFIQNLFDPKTFNPIFLNKILDPKNFCPQNFFDPNLSPKKMCVPKNLCPKKIWSRKNLAQNILVPKNFGFNCCSKQFFFKKNFGFQKILGLKNFGSRKMVGPHKCWVPINVGSP